MRRPHFLSIPTTAAAVSPTAAEDSLALNGGSLAVDGVEHRIDPAEDCPVIYADKVYLGRSFRRQLRVVCFENPSPAARAS
jgi:hypothetical protein